MKAEQRNTLEGYVHHAEHYGVEEVFETAVDGGLGLRDLGRLALRLQNLDSRWKLTPDCQRYFVLALVRSGVSSPSKAAQQAGCSVQTARNWINDARDDFEAWPEDPEMALRRASKDRFEHLQAVVRDPAKRR